MLTQGLGRRLLTAAIAVTWVSGCLLPTIRVDANGNQAGGTTSVTAAEGASNAALGGTTGNGGVPGTGGSPTAGGTTGVFVSAAKGGTTAVGGATAIGGTTAKGGSSNLGGATAIGGTTAKGGSSSLGGTTAIGGTTAKGGSSSLGGTTAIGGTTAKGGSSNLGGTTAIGNVGKTVTFSSGKALGAMTGYAFVALGSAATITSPTCGATLAAVTEATPCTTGYTWSSATVVCMTGSLPALPAAPTSADFAANWGVSLGVNAADPFPGTGLGQTLTSVTITTTGSPLTGLRATVHRKGDADSVTYCGAMTSGTAIPFTNFVTDCYNPVPTGAKITATDVPNIDRINVQVSSGTAAITVTNLCITGITFS